VNLRYDNQVIVNPDMEGKARPAAMNPARTAEAAGVKPAAMITRMPSGRPVPKPAFELSEKKLDLKAQSPGRKTAPKSKSKKAASTTSVSGAKKKTTAAKTASPTTSKAAAKSSGNGNGQKPSPSVAKKQADPVPSD
jgi:hypothetical protein